MKKTHRLKQEEYYCLISIYCQCLFPRASNSIYKPPLWSALLSQSCRCVKALINWKPFLIGRIALISIVDFIHLVAKDDYAHPRRPSDYMKRGKLRWPFGPEPVAYQVGGRVPKWPLQLHGIEFYIISGNLPPVSHLTLAAGAVNFIHEVLSWSCRHARFQSIGSTFHI